MTEGTVVAWSVAVGDEVSAGDVLCDIETDKATMAMESSEDGYIAALLVEDGTGGIPVGAPVAVMVEDEGEEADMSVVEAASAAGAAVEEAPAPAASAAAVAAPAAPAAPVAVAQGATAKPLSPAVLAMVNRHGLDAGAIPATGPKGHILKGDVLAFMSGEVVGAPAAPAPVAAAAAAPAADGAVPLKPDGTPRYTDIPASNIRKIIASRLTESKTQIPHAYATIDVDVTAMMKWRKETIEATGEKFSVNDVIIKSSALALRSVPEVNVALGEDGEPVRLSTVDISVAVATPTGLITPIVFGADSLGVTGISGTVRELAGRARDGGLKPEEFQGGTFSVSNLGMFGITAFSAVINPPQSCILAVGGTRPVVCAETMGIKQMATFTISADARVVDDAMSQKFLASFKRFMENPIVLG
jgi:pyruvate dehydrogenase complex dihydrolipoamide acetyltransferase long form